VTASAGNVGFYSGFPLALLIGEAQSRATQVNDGSGKIFTFDNGYLTVSNRSSKIQYDGPKYIAADCIALQPVASREVRVF
jgi:hypothetical protein